MVSSEASAWDVPPSMFGARSGAMGATLVAFNGA